MTVTIIHKKRWQQGALFLLLVCAAVALLRWPAAAATGVSRGLAVCAEVIIPSMFPFLVISGLFVRSGLAQRVGRRLEGVMRRLFHLPGRCGVAVLISTVGGYPSGAAAIRDMLAREEITEKQAARLLCFCVNAGPGFLIGTVGARLLGSVYKGILLYIAHTVACLLIGLFCSAKEKSEPCRKPPPDFTAPLMQSVVDAVSNACSTVIAMCGFVMLFSAFLTLCDVSGLIKVMSYPFTLVGIEKWIPQLYPSFFEVSCGCVTLVGSALYGVPLAFLLGAALGWGGLSVACQVGGMLAEYRLPKKEYFVARGWHALLGGGLSALLFGVLPMPAGEAVNVSGRVDSFVAIQPVSVSAAASAAMLLLCGAFLFWVARE